MATTTAVTTTTVMPAAAAGADTAATVVPAIREAQVAAAVQFFISTSTTGAPFSRKLRFLETQKSLTPTEALEAMRRYFAGNSAAAGAEGTPPELRAVEEGVLRGGKTATEAMEEYEKANPGVPQTVRLLPGAAAAGAPVSVTTTTTGGGAAQSAAGTTRVTTTVTPPSSAYTQYAVPPGYIAGPSPYPGGPPTLYPVPGARGIPAAAPAPPAASGWRTAAWAAAGMIGGAAAVGYAARKLGYELVKPISGAAGSMLPGAASASSAGATPADSLSALLSTNPAILPSSSSASNAAATGGTLGSADHRLGGPGAGRSGRASVSGGSSDHGGTDGTLTSALAALEASEQEGGGGEDEDEKDHTEEKYLSAWLGDSGATSSSSTARRLAVSGSRDSLALELRHVSEQLDRVVEALKDNQIELRRISGSRAASASSSESLSSARLESLLAQSASTQTDMLATLKIMLAAQARATKEEKERLQLVQAEKERMGMGGGATSAISATSVSTDASSAVLPAASPSSSSLAGVGSSSSDGSVPAAASSSGGLMSGAAFAPPSATSTPAPLSSTSASSSIPTSSAHASAFSSVSPTTDPLAEGSRLLDEALVQLRTSNAIEIVRPACTNLELYLSNLLTHMSSSGKTQYRRILLSNSGYESRVRKCVGAERFLLASGFQINRPYIEWVLPDPSSEVPSPPCGSSVDGTGTGLVMDEAQKKVHLEVALKKLREFQAKLASGEFEGGGQAQQQQQQQQQMGSDLTSAAAASSSSNPPSASSTPVPQQLPSQPPQSNATIGAPVPYGQPAQQAAPQTSYSAYADTMTQPPVQQQSQPTQQQLAPHQASAMQAPPTTNESGAFDPSQQAQAPLQPMPVYENGVSDGSAPQFTQQQQQQPNGQYAPAQQQNAQLQSPPQSQQQWSAPQTSYNNSQAFSYPNTPFHATPQQQQQANGGMMHPNGQQQMYSVPNTPLPPPQFAQQQHQGYNGNGNGMQQQQHQHQPGFDGYGKPLQDAYGATSRMDNAMQQSQPHHQPASLEQPTPMYAAGAPPHYMNGGHHNGGGGSGGGDSRFGYGHSGSAGASGLEHLLAAAGQVNAIDAASLPAKQQQQHQL